MELPEAGNVLKFNARFCLLNLMDESDFVSQRITSVFTKVSGPDIFVVSIGDLTSFFTLEQLPMLSKTNILNMPETERRYDLVLMPGIIYLVNILIFKVNERPVIDKLLHNQLSYAVEMR